MSGGGRLRGVDLVVGAGDLRGAAALGAARALARAGMPLAHVWGASTGALFAAAVALGWDAETAVAVVRSLWTADLLRGPTPRARAQLAFPRRLGFDVDFGLVDDTRLLERLRRAFGSTDFADTRTPLTLVAADRFRGEGVALTEGRLVEALRAALGVPWVFPPVAHGDAWLEDAAAVEPWPARRALNEGASVVVGVAFEPPLPAHGHTPIHLALQQQATASRQLLRAAAELEERGAQGRVVRLSVPFPSAGRRFDADVMEPAVALGEQAMEARLPALQALVTALR